MAIPFPVISSWDPRATSSGSIDPLGALRAYNAIAGFLLPGVTTITTRPRYLSWLCAGLCLLDEAARASAAVGGRSRRQRLLVWERFLVLATGYYAASNSAAIDAPEWRWLRGVSYVRDAVRQGRTSTEFELLKNQAGVGGVGTYWVTTVQGGLVDDVSASLTERGSRLAEEFLKRLAPVRDKLHRILAGNIPRFSREELVSWGRLVSLDVSSASATEVRCLRDALLEPAAHRLLCGPVRAIRNPDSSARTFKRLERALRKERQQTANSIAAVMELTRAFESVHAGLLDQFDRLRALDMRGMRVDRTAAIDALDISGDLAARGAELERCLTSLPELPREVSTPMRQFLTHVRPILDSRSKFGFLQELCAYHERVQAGKLDVSRQPKQAWVQLRGGALVVAPRFAIDGFPEPREAFAFTHPYRIESFAGMLSEVDRVGGAAR
jgi:hypothetical protein